MNRMSTNSDVLNLIGSEELIRDGFIVKVDMNFDILINIKFEIHKINSSPFFLIFSKVKAFEIQSEHELDNKGILLSQYKLFVMDNEYVYFSFDPYGEQHVDDLEDNNFIICEKVEIITGLKEQD